MFSVIYF